MAIFIYDEEAVIYLCTVNNNNVVDAINCNCIVEGVVDTATNNAILSTAYFYIDSSQLTPSECNIAIYAIYSPTFNRVFNFKIKNNNNNNVNFNAIITYTVFNSIKNKIAGSCDICDTSVPMVNVNGYTTINETNLNTYVLSYIQLNATAEIEDIDYVIDGSIGCLINDARIVKSTTGRGICIRLDKCVMNNNDVE